MTGKRRLPLKGKHQFKMTPKMLAVLKSVVRRNPDGTLLDVYQLMELHGNGATRQAMQYTLGYLERQKMIEPAPMRPNGTRGRRTIAATQVGIDRVRPRNLPIADQ